MGEERLETMTRGILLSFAVKRSKKRGAGWSTM